MLIPIEEVLDKAAVKNYRQQLDSAQWQDGKITAGGQAFHVKNNQQVENFNDIALKLGQEILQTLSAHPVFISAALPKKIFPPKFNRYRGGGHYGLHVDNAIMHLPDHQMMRTDISATLFLSEPDEYEGGELIIETDYGIQEVKLNAGDMILYPATSLHEVKPVTDGTRVCSFFWVESMIRGSQQREMLYDLDQSIQVLSGERGSDDPEVRRLAGIYHNLIRRWATS
tara:strand:+ start:201 stop:881 length:681 start_codon:yes stop_codon:yes gene_type:complete